jgi:hypothetical protein
MKPLCIQYIILAALSFGAIGCSLIQNDASVCSSKETASEIFELIKQSETPAIQAFIGINPSFVSKVNAAVDSLTASGNISLINVTFEGADKSTKKIECKGNIHFNYTDKQKLAMSQNPISMSQNDVPISFYRQPSADGKSLIFAFQDPTNLSGEVGIAGLLELLGDKKPSANNQNSNAAASASSVGNAVPGAEQNESGSEVQQGAMDPR